MDQSVIPPMPQWHEPSIMACSPDNTLFYGAWRDIVVVKQHKPGQAVDVKFIRDAHLTRVSSLALYPHWEEHKFLASTGDDGFVRVWDMETLELKTFHSAHKGEKIAGVSMAKEHVVSVRQDGQIIVWRLLTNTLVAKPEFFLGNKVHVTTIACCPFLGYIAAFGLRSGLVLIVDLRNNGRLLHRLRLHTSEIVGLSWCPTPFNVLAGLGTENTGKKKFFINRNKPAKKIVEVEPASDDANKTTAEEKSSDLDKSVEKESSSDVDKTVLEDSTDVKPTAPLLSSSDGLDEAIEKEMFFGEDKTACEGSPTALDQSAILRSSSDGLDKTIDKELPSLKTSGEIKSTSDSSKAIKKDCSDGLDDTIVLHSASDLDDTAENNSSSEFLGFNEQTQSEDKIEKLSDENVQVQSSSNQPASEADSGHASPIASPEEKTAPHAKESEVANPSVEIPEEPIKTVIPAKDYLLASCCVQETVCIWRAGSDGRLQAEIRARSRAFHPKHRPVKKDIGFWWADPYTILVSTASGIMQTIDLGKKTPKGFFDIKIVHSYHSKSISCIRTPWKLYWNFEDISREEIPAWSFSMDRWVNCVGIRSHDVFAAFPTFCNRTYCLEASPIDPNRVFFGCADSSMGLWDLSNPKKNILDVSFMHYRVKCKIISLASHPVKEFILAFGTDEGIIGLYGVGHKAHPVILPQYHRSAVYSLAWGPTQDVGDGQDWLYSCANGKIVAHNVQIPTQDPKLLKINDDGFVSEFSWKPDAMMLLVGFKDGKISLYDRSLQLVRSFYFLAKSISCIAWHPESTASEDDVSVYASWFAASAVDKDVVIFDSNAEEAEGASLKAVLSGHASEIHSLRWSPHESLRLASTSKDGYVQVWDVKEKKGISSILAHDGCAVFCIVWHPCDPDVVITGGNDHSLRLNKISQNPPVKISIDKVKGSKSSKKSQGPATAAAQEADDAAVPEKSIMLPCFARKQNKYSLENCIKLLERRSSTECEVEAEKFNVAIGIFEQRDNILQILAAEQVEHSKKKHWESVQNLALWKGDVGEQIKEAIAQGQLNPWIISIAPMVSHKLWRDACEAYAEYLEENGNGRLASTYFLSCHQVERAIEALSNANMFREAIALAQCRLGPGTTVDGIIAKWADYLQVNGSYELAAQCYIHLKRYEDASKVLSKRNTCEPLEVAVRLAILAGNQELADGIQLRIAMVKDKTSLKKLPSRFEACLLQKAKVEGETTEPNETEVETVGDEPKQIETETVKPTEVEVVETVQNDLKNVEAEPVELKEVEVQTKETEEESAGNEPKETEAKAENPGDDSQMESAARLNSDH